MRKKKKKGFLARGRLLRYFIFKYFIPRAINFCVTPIRSLKRERLGPTSMAQLVGHGPAHQKVCLFDSGHGTSLYFGSISYRRWAVGN